MRFLVLVLVYVPAIMAGLGVISPGWILGSMLIAYAKSITDVAATSGLDDFRQLESKVYLEKERSIKLAFLGQAALVGIAYALAFLISVFL